MHSSGEQKPNKDKGLSNMAKTEMFLWENMHKSWENHGKIMGKSWENHWTTMGKACDNSGKVIGKRWGKIS